MTRGMGRFSFAFGMVLLALFFENNPLKAEQMPAGELVFELHGTVVGKQTLLTLQKAVLPRTLSVFDFEANAKVVYQGLPLIELLQHIYGDRWRGRDDIQFTCSDGYQPAVPVQDALKYAPLLAFRFDKPGSFVLLKNSSRGGSKTLDLGPFYLIWDNLRFKELLARGPMFWPYQIEKINLTDFSEHYRKSAPPRSAPTTVRSGFALFRSHCLSCHTMNGEGGQVAQIELNQPASVTQYFKRSWLIRWITNPSRVRKNARMAAYGENKDKFSLSAKSARKEIEKIVAYLEWMAPKPMKSTDGEDE